MGKFNADGLLGKRQFRYLTGVSSDISQQMVLHLSPAWDRLRQSKNRAGRPFGVGGLEYHLLVMLILYRCHITQDFLALLYGVDKATICRSLRRIEKISQRTLGAKRKITVSEEEAQALLIDATEQPVQRPERKQKCWYSGKKKRHCIKNEIIATEKGRIVFVSKSAPGTVHDITLHRRGSPLPENSHAYADGGYQGYQDDHPSLDTALQKTEKRKPHKTGKGIQPRPLPLSCAHRTFHRAHEKVSHPRRPLSLSENTAHREIFYYSRHYKSHGGVLNRKSTKDIAHLPKKSYFCNRSNIDTNDPLYRSGEVIFDKTVSVDGKGSWLLNIEHEGGKFIQFPVITVPKLTGPVYWVKILARGENLTAPITINVWRDLDNNLIKNLANS